MTLSTRLRELADLVERVEDSLDVEVQDARLAGVSADGDLLRGDLTVLVPIDADTAAESQPVTDDVVDEPEPRDQADEATDIPLDEAVCDVEGGDYSGSEHGLAIHKGHAHADDGDESDDIQEDAELDAADEPTAEGDDQAVADEVPLEEQIADVLEEEGKVSSKEIELLLETSSSHYRNILSRMQRDGRVESRRDPDDGRLRLYWLADNENLPSSEDGTDTSESEAPDADLEEDDGGTGAGDEESGETFPRDCRCGATLEDSLELAIHRTEEHGVPQALLGHLDPGEFEEIVREAEGIQDVIDEVDWSSERTLRIIGMYGLGDVISAAPGTDNDVESVEEPEAVTATNGGAATETGDGDSTAPVGQKADESDDAGAEPGLDLAKYGIGRDELVDAIAGSQTVHHVQRDLRVDRDTTIQILTQLGLFEEMATGCRSIREKQARDAIRKEVTA
ncbi:hypothetical protein BRD17_04025 [Halobacteriales archaeon SW_7_68_16]|nr:MAG: hypothetical protein BRD17_04025 [Halobacteriales archaeon SW_7_68_16]